MWLTLRRACFCLLFVLNFHSLPSDQAPGEGGAWKEASDVSATLNAVKGTLMKG